MPNITKMLAVMTVLMCAACQAPVIPKYAPQGSPVRDEVARRVYEQCAPSVVFISADGGTGTGFICKVGERTVIITAGHVVEDKGAKYKVDGVSIDPAQIHRYAGADVAWIDVRLPGRTKFLTLAPLTPMVGDDVYAIGDPYSFKNVISVGIVNQFTDGLMGISSALAPGNSGCPVVDARGNVVGVGVARMADSEHLSFAVMASDIVKMLK